MKFEVGERVQFIEGNEVKSGKIIDMENNFYALVETGDNIGSKFHIKDIAKLDQPEPQSEKVKKINEIMLELIHRKDLDILSDDDITRMLIEALDIVNTLDQPEPVVVPKFVAECIREYELVLSDGYSTKDTVLDNIIQDWALGGIDSDFSDWVDDNLITLIDAVRNGYVVEEEKKWKVSKGDLVIRKGEREAKVYFVESIDQKDNKITSVLLVNGIKDELYGGEGAVFSINYFFKKFRLLAKSENLEEVEAE